MKNSFPVALSEAQPVFRPTGQGPTTALARGLGLSGWRLGS